VRKTFCESSTPLPTVIIYHIDPIVGPVWVLASVGGWFGGLGGFWTLCVRKGIACFGPLITLWPPLRQFLSFCLGVEVTNSHVI